MHDFSTTLRSALLALAVTTGVGAQITLHLPDPNPQVPGGASVNTIPFGSAAYTYMGRIAASQMDPTYTRIDDVSFAPPTSGTWNASTVIIGFGHLPTPLPCPFSFPQFTVPSNGSFLDFTVAFDSAVHGPINWVWTAGQFSPMGLDNFAPTGFTWNGVNDVGVFITFTGASPTSGFYRDPVGPLQRTYASSFQAASSTACGSLFALVMALDLSIPGNILTVDDGGPAVNNLVITLGSITPAATEGWILISGDVGLPLGTGPFFGITPDAITWELFLSTPIADGNPLHFPVPSTFGLFPNTPFFLPSGSTASLNGLTLDFVTVLVEPGFVYSGRSNVVRYAF